MLGKQATSFSLREERVKIVAHVDLRRVLTRVNKSKFHLRDRVIVLLSIRAGLAHSQKVRSGFWIRIRTENGLARLQILHFKFFGAW